MMHELLQIIVKTVFTAFLGLIIVGVFWGIVCVWKSDIDVGKLLSPRRVVKEAAEKLVSPLPIREQDAIYQHGEIVARVTGVSENEAEGVVSFKEVYKSNDLKRDSEFEFRTWRLTFQHAEQMVDLSSSEAHKGRMFKNVTCQIVGKR